MSASTDEIPKKLKANGRQPDSVFKTTEELFRRISFEDLDDRGGVDVCAFDEGWPKLSFNRGKYSVAKDVRYPVSKFSECGAAVLKVCDVPVGGRPSEGNAWHLTVQHSPLEDNYSHSELVSHVETGIDGLTVKKPGRVEMTRLRLELAQKSRVALPPVSQSSKLEQPAGCFGWIGNLFNH